MDQHQSHMDLGQVPYAAYTPAEEQQGYPDYAHRYQVAATQTSHLSTQDIIRKVEASTNTAAWPSGFSDFEKNKGSFFVDRIVIWALGIVIVAALIVCVVAIFVTRASTDSTTTVLPTPPDTEDLLAELANMPRDVIRDVFRTTTPRTTTSSVLPETNADNEITSTEENTDALGRSAEDSVGTASPTETASGIMDSSKDVESVPEGSNDTVVIGGRNA